LASVPPAVGPGSSWTGWPPRMGGQLGPGVVPRGAEEGLSPPILDRAVIESHPATAGHAAAKCGAHGARVAAGHWMDQTEARATDHSYLAHPRRDEVPFPPEYTARFARHTTPVGSRLVTLLGYRHGGRRDTRHAAGRRTQRYVTAGVSCKTACAEARTDAAPRPRRTPLSSPSDPSPDPAGRQAGVGRPTGGPRVWPERVGAGRHGRAMTVRRQIAPRLYSAPRIDECRTRWDR